MFQKISSENPLIAFNEKNQLCRERLEKAYHASEIKIEIKFDKPFAFNTLNVSLMYLYTFRDANSKSI